MHLAFFQAIGPINVVHLISFRTLALSPWKHSTVSRWHVLRRRGWSSKMLLHLIPSLPLWNSLVGCPSLNGTALQLYVVAAALQQNSDALSSALTEACSFVLQINSSRDKNERPSPLPAGFLLSLLRPILHGLVCIIIMRSLCTCSLIASINGSKGKFSGLHPGLSARSVSIQQTSHRDRAHRSYFHVAHYFFPQPISTEARGFQQLPACRSVTERI